MQASDTQRWQNATLTVLDRSSIITTMKMANEEQPLSACGLFRVERLALACLSRPIAQRHVRYRCRPAVFCWALAEAGGRHGST